MLRAAIRPVADGENGWGGATVKTQLKRKSYVSGGGDGSGGTSESTLRGEQRGGGFGSSLGGILGVDPAVHEDPVGGVGGVGPAAIERGRPRQHVDTPGQPGLG